LYPAPHRHTELQHTHSQPKWAAFHHDPSRQRTCPRRRRASVGFAGPVLAYCTACTWFLGFGEGDNFFFSIFSVAFLFWYCFTSPSLSHHNNGLVLVGLCFCSLAELPVMVLQNSRMSLEFGSGRSLFPLVLSFYFWSYFIIFWSFVSFMHFLFYIFPIPLFSLPTSYATFAIETPATTLFQFRLAQLALAATGGFLEVAILVHIAV
jgi:hypothetical protein